MLFFGHLGITLGIFFVLKLIVPKLGSHIDLLFLALGSLLPDIIDKPIGRWFFVSTFANGRIFAHSLIFSLFLGLLGLYYYRKNRDMQLISLFAGSFCHLLEDSMWRSPKTFFWPFLGWQFPKGGIYWVGLEYFIKMFKRSFEPEFSYTYLSEITGITIVVFLLINVFMRGYNSWKKYLK